MLKFQQKNVNNLALYWPTPPLWRGFALDPTEGEGASAHRNPGFRPHFENFCIQHWEPPPLWTPGYAFESVLHARQCIHVTGKCAECVVIAGWNFAGKCSRGGRGGGGGEWNCQKRWKVKVSWQWSRQQTSRKEKPSERGIPRYPLNSTQLCAGKMQQGRGNQTGYWKHTPRTSWDTLLTNYM